MAGIKRTSADKWFSLYIRARDNWTCQRCGRVFREYIKGADNRHLRGLDCAHMIGRGAKMTRFEPDNAVSLCYGCHSHLDSRPTQKVEFMIERLGQERYDEIRALSKKPFLHFKKHKKEISNKFRKKFRELIK